ncbi:type II secretion system F family protein [Nocardioides ganghwensis]|jgi:tight adherence protein C|uniref:Type II secretion system F family protein n=1 Tax=Nocardioides ganghwensis TaxID=252230 RepID=A0A4V1RMH0_9ACTN|nr:type II secretion system F family protein [Nocardioides ganghwensis]MBD3946979.1 type II secretion system F family protein [Nocardioides ganghwensis]RYC01901.1 type II secretion system F family protein [Nocardioides ganghwensis]
MGATIMLAGAALLCAGLTLALSIIGVATSERRGVARSVAAIQAIDSAPAELKGEIERPFAERVIAPLGDRLVVTGRRLVRADTARKIQYRLNVAGNPPAWDVNRILGLKVLGLGVFGVLGFLYLLGLGWPFYRVVVVTGLVATFGYVLPNVLLYNAGTKRAAQMRNGLPDAMDLLTISVEAGLGFDAAVSRVAKNSDGPLANEFARLLQEMQIGRGRADAMRAMAERTSLPDLKSFCLAMVQADSLGIPIARVLRIQSQEMRTKRRQRAEEKAQQVPVRMMIPLVLFILPCLFLVILGPAGISIAESFSSR